MNDKHKLAAALLAFTFLLYILLKASDSLVEIGTVKNPGSKNIRGSSLGIGFECLDRKIFDPEKTYDKLEKTGVKWARCQTGWNRCETQKGVYDFKWLDGVVDNLISRGIRPWFNVGFGNPIYMENLTNPAAVGHVPLYYGEEVKAAWGNFLRALAEHFKGRVEYYEIWNEPNIVNFWRPAKPSVSEYMKLIRFSRENILKGDPGAKIGACVSGGMSGYVESFFNAGGGKFIDFFAVHPYQILPEQNYAAMAGSIRALMRETSGREIPLWQGESGYGSYFPEGHFLKTWHRGSQKNQAKWLLRRFATDLSLKIPLTSFFQCVDLTAAYQTGVGKQSPSLHGILENVTYREKEAYYALKNFCAVFDSDTKPSEYFAAADLTPVRPRSEKISRLPDMAAIAYAFERNGYPLVAYYMPEDLQLESAAIDGVKLSVLGGGLKRVENPVLIDMLDGKVYKIAKGKTSGNPYAAPIFRNLPLKDYPLVLTDFEAVKDRISLAR